APVEPLAALPGEARALRHAAAKLGAAAPDAKAWTRLAARAARKLRADDVDHLYIDAALGAIDRITLGIGPRGTAVGVLGPARARREGLRPGPAPHPAARRPR